MINKIEKISTTQKKAQSQIRDLEILEELNEDGQLPAINGGITEQQWQEALAFIDNLDNVDVAVGHWSDGVSFEHAGIYGPGYSASYTYLRLEY